MSQISPSSASKLRAKSARPIDASVVDTSKWPALVPETVEINAAWKSLSDIDREEYTAALLSMASSSLRPSGLIQSGERIFHFMLEGPVYPDIYIAWTAPNGTSYGIGYAGDEQLRKTAETDPIAAAGELSRRFSLFQVRDEDSPWPFERELHAVTVLSEFLSELGLPGMSRPLLFADHKSGNILFEVDDPDAGPIKRTRKRAPERYRMIADHRSGPLAQRHLFMINSMIEGSLHLHFSWDDYSRAEIQTLADEVNAVLSAAQLPIIPSDAVARAQEKAPAYCRRRG